MAGRPLPGNQRSLTGSGGNTLSAANRLAGKARTYLTFVLCGLLALILTAMVVLEATQVALRYGFGTGFIWTGDVSVLLMQWLAWIGAPALWLRRGHINIDLIDTLFGNKATQRLFRLLDGVMIAGALAILYFGLDVLAAFSLTEIPSLGLSGDVKYYPIMASACLLVVTGSINLMDQRSIDSSADSRP